MKITCKNERKLSSGSNELCIDKKNPRENIDNGTIKSLLLKISMNDILLLMTQQIKQKNDIEKNKSLTEKL